MFGWWLLSPLVLLCSLPLASFNYSRTPPVALMMEKVLLYGAHSGRREGAGGEAGGQGTAGKGEEGGQQGSEPALREGTQQRGLQVLLPVDNGLGPPGKPLHLSELLFSLPPGRENGVDSILITIDAMANYISPLLNY